MERLTFRYKNHVLLNVDKTFEDYNEALEKLADYEDLEEQELLLRLPCKIGDTVYQVRCKYSKCTAYGECFDDYFCSGCEKECDSKKEYYIKEMVVPSINWIVDYMDMFNEQWFLTKLEAEQALAKLESEIN
jgi:hypothetical protein